jgi:type I restriction enzyme S subunit
MTVLLKEHYPFAENALPAGWAEAPIGAIAQDIRSGFSSGRHNMHGIGIPHLRPMNVTADGKVTLENARYVAPSAGDLRLRDGDLLFTNTSSTLWVGKTGVVNNPGDWGFSNHMTRLRLRTGLSSEFFAKQLHYLCRAGFFAHHCTEHVNQSSIAPSLLRDSVPVRVPPLEEQRRIMTRLGELEASSHRARAHLSETPAQLAETRRALLATAFTGALTKDWRSANRNETPSQIVEAWRRAGRVPVETPAPIPDAPKSWSWVTLESILRTPSDLAYGILKPGPMVRDGVPMLRVMDIGDGAILEHDIFRVAPHVAGQFARTQLEAGDILLAVMATIGRSAVVPARFAGANVNRALAVLKLDPAVDSDFACAYLRSPFLQEKFQSEKVGSAQSRINLSELRLYPFPLPSLEEQREIVRRLEAGLARLSAAVRAYDAAISDLDLLEQSLLARAFRGELVPQDQTEEAAEILLKRLADEAAAQPDEPRKRMPRKTKPSAATELPPILQVLRESNGSLSPEDLFQKSGRDESDLEQVEKFYADLRQLVHQRKIKETRPDSATVLLTAAP